MIITKGELHNGNDNNFPPFPRNRRPPSPRPITEDPPVPTIEDPPQCPDYRRPSRLSPL